MLLPLLALLISASWNFEGGSAGRFEAAGPAHIRVGVKGEKDQDGRNRQGSWYYFLVTNYQPGQTVTVDLIDLPGEYNYQPNRGAVVAETPAVWSEDGRTWRHVEDFQYDAAEPHMRLRVKPSGRRFWIAHTAPYTNRNLAELAKLVPQKRIIGHSVEKRPLWLWTIGAGPKTVALMFRQHSWETGSSWVGEGAVRELLANEKLRNEATWLILPTADPDGIARGGVRFNKFGYDLNRNWDTNGIDKMPEITAQRQALGAGPKPDLFLSVHNTETAEWLQGPPTGHREIAERFFRLLSEKSSFAPTKPLFFEGPFDRGRANVLQGLFKDLGIPAFLMEQRISTQAKYGRRPLVEDRLRFGRELVNVIAETIKP